MSIMLELNHPHIIKLLDFFDNKDYFYMVVEKVNGGSARRRKRKFQMLRGWQRAAHRAPV